VQHQQLLVTGLAQQIQQAPVNGVLDHAASCITASGRAASARSARCSQQAAESLGIALQRTARLYTGDEQVEPFFELVEAHAHDLESLASAFESSWARFLESQPDSSRWPTLDSGAR
jgi:hypothetical protein